MKDSVDAREKITKNFAWRFLERVGAKGVELLVSIVLARLLAPDVYGTIALVTVFIAILQVFVDSGLGNALIQKKDADDLDFSTVFFFNVLFCLILYFLLFMAAPFIAHFYNDLSLTPVIRVLGLTVVISGIKNVQQAYVSRKMMFRKFFYATLGGTIGAAIVGIYMAYRGCGVWALVAQQMFNIVMDTIILWLSVKWHPKWMFSFQRLRILYSYGWKLLASSLIEVVYNNIRQLIIGRMYSAGDLAYYNRAKQFPQFISSNINTSINSVLFPAMSNAQENPERVKAMTRRAIKTSTYIMAPMMMGLAACSKSVISILLTDKWLPCVPFLMIFCTTEMFLPIHTANLNAIKAMGRSDLYLRLEIIKKVVGITSLLITMKYGVMAMAYSLLVTSVISQMINSWPNKKLLHYAYPEQVRDILPGIMLAIVMGIIVYMLNFIELNEWHTLMIQVPIGLGIYVIGSKLLHIDSFDYVMEIIKSFFSRMKAR